MDWKHVKTGISRTFNEIYGDLLELEDGEISQAVAVEMTLDAGRLDGTIAQIRSPEAKAEAQAELKLFNELSYDEQDAIAKQVLSAPSYI